MTRYFSTCCPEITFNRANIKRFNTAQELEVADEGEDEEGNNESAESAVQKNILYYTFITIPYVLIFYLFINK